MRRKPVNNRFSCVYIEAEYIISWPCNILLVFLHQRKQSPYKDKGRSVFRLCIRPLFQYAEESRTCEKI